MPTKSSLPGLWKYPTYRDDPLKSGVLWLKGKQVDDGAEGLWRIHDDLYDFSSWIHKHPGGVEWLELTKGTDITEAFEAHHVTVIPENILKYFHVKQAVTRRNSPYTFKENGFYRTLKNKVRKYLMHKPISSRKNFSKLYADAFLTITVALAVLALKYHSYWVGTLSGLFLAFTVISAHNFFHQKDNFRMYYFDLSLMSSRDWRISHALSHHLYPNSLLDLEISLLEPALQWLPYEAKSFWVRYGSWLYSPIAYSYLFHGQLVLRLSLILNGYFENVRKTDFIPFLLPAVMYILSGCDIFQVLAMWVWLVVAGSFFFGVIGFNGAHHHPDVFHDGDTPRNDADWGLAQLDTIRDREIVSDNLFLALTQFGHHGLHHLFPTIDHCYLPDLYPLLLETCEEFGIKYEHPSIWEMVKGQFMELARINPNKVPPRSA